VGLGVLEGGTINTAVLVGAIVREGIGVLVNVGTMVGKGVHVGEISIGVCVGGKANSAGLNGFHATPGFIKMVRNTIPIHNVINSTMIVKISSNCSLKPPEAFLPAGPSKLNSLIKISVPCSRR